MTASRQEGLALVSVLLVLTVMLVFAVTAQQMVLLTALTIRNQLALSQAEAEQESLMNLALLLTEAQLEAGGRLPESALMPAGADYVLESAEQARITISAIKPALAVELTVMAHSGRVTVTGRR